MKQFDTFRARRSGVYDRLFGARALCVAGLLAMPAMLFNPVTQFRVFQFLFFWFLAWLSGKKNNPFLTILVILGIVIFNLIMPYGRVLFSAGVFKITAGALEGGIHRAVTLEGLIMLSRAAIRPDLRLPGIFGELAGESFRVLAAITARKRRITRKNFIADIDELMIELSGEGGDVSGPAGVPASGTKASGFIILAVAVILSWLPWAAARYLF